MAWTAVRTWVAGEIVTASIMNTHIRDNSQYLFDQIATPDRPGCKAYHSAAQSINTATATALAFDSEDFDSDAMHSTVTNNTRITIPTGKGGKYNVWGFNQWQANATGNRQLSVRKNGVATDLLLMFQVSLGGGASMMQSLAGELSLAAGDYVEMFVTQNSGGALNATQAANLYPLFGARYQRP